MLTVGHTDEPNIGLLGGSLVLFGRGEVHKDTKGKRIEDKNNMKEKRNKAEKPTQRKMRPGGRLNVVLEGGRVSLSHLLGSLICVLISRNATVGM